MTYYVVIGAAAVVIFLLTAVIFVRRRKRAIKKTPYVDALHLLLEGKNDDALEQLKRVIKHDTENIMAYIKLGDILREKGLASKAAKIHKNLLVRSDVKEGQKNVVLYHLTLDYQHSGNLKKAIESAEELVHRNKKNIEYQKLLLSLYEKNGQWDKAFFQRQSIRRWLKREDQDVLALYKVFTGLDLVKEGAEKEARIRFREAVKLNKGCIPAYLYWGDSYRRENRNEDACRIYKEFTIKNPDWAHLVFERLSSVLFDLGRYGEMENIYKQVIQKNSNSPHAYVKLAELYRKQSMLKEAVELCQKVLADHPDFSDARYLYIDILKQMGERDRALEESLKILEKDIQKEKLFHCSRCGYESKEPLWLCPECQEWNTFLKETE